MLSQKSAVFDSKKWRFMKEQEAKRTLRSLCLKTPLSKIPLFGGIFLLFSCLNLLNVTASML